jgi:acyl dehydratase
MEGKLSAQLEVAEREQRNIYMQLVPKDLPEVAPKKMVQPKEPSEVLTRSEEWFTDIVPDKVTRHLSKCAAAASPHRGTAAPGTCCKRLPGTCRLRRTCARRRMHCGPGVRAAAPVHMHV